VLQRLQRPRRDPGAVAGGARGDRRAACAYGGERQGPSPPQGEEGWPCPWRWQRQGMTAPHRLKAGRLAVNDLAIHRLCRAEQCPPGALGVSRTLVVDPNEHSRVGSMQYPETLPLNDHEVVLTFDDGPLPRYTNRVLETLASECVKATFFMVGQMARAYPWMVRRVYDEGHTVANHTQNHPIRKMSVDQAAREIEEGFASLREAIGDPQAVSPFFRIPGLLRQKSVEQYLAAHGDMTWSADFLADDWTRINNSEVARRAISRIEARGKGILLLHDIHPRTVLALPEILNEFKSRGYKIVHVVPAAADRPKTATSAQQWVARPTPEQHTSPSQMRPLRQGISRRRGQEPEPK
jgi:peptidoglycan-N-acetylglucosamine deacetylase